MFKYRKYNWQDGKQLELKDRTLIMGILNGTPDSFSDGGRYNTSDTAVAHAKSMIEEGADIIDVGVESTRPGHTQISVEEELQRMKDILLPVLDISTVPVSVDTYRAETADFALSHGAHILNDIWGLKYDKDMAAVAAKYDVPVIIMHNQNTTDYDDIIDDMKAFFFSSVDLALKEGVKPQNIWLDPGIGIGFGKDYAQNVEVIQRLGEITVYEYPVLLAPSRKGFIGTILNDIPADQRDEGTVAACITGMIQGVDMVRVHNVEMHKRAITVADVLLRGE